ncbi:hypothetical protein JCM33374_g2182 [Metschnikowia sp. JCM 33374]|nr:hypothetical protein JCM33374_g2182 [Metschnikowia sp. JCM 33374]
MSSILPKQRGKNVFRLSWGDSGSRRASASTDTVNTASAIDPPPKYQFTADEIQGYPVVHRARNTIKRSSRVVSSPENHTPIVPETRRRSASSQRAKAPEAAPVPDAAARLQNPKRMKQPSQKSLNEDWISEILSDTENAKARRLSPEDALRIQEWLTRASSLPQRKPDDKKSANLKTRKGQVVTEKGKKDAPLASEQKEPQDIRFPATPMELSNFAGVYHPQLHVAPPSNGHEFVAPVTNAANVKSEPADSLHDDQERARLAAERKLTGAESPKSNSSGNSSTFESYYSVKTSADSNTECSSLEVLSVGVCEPLAISSSHESPVDMKFVESDSSIDRSTEKNDADVTETQNAQIVPRNFTVRPTAPLNNEEGADDARYRFEISLENLLARSSSESLTIRSETDPKVAALIGKGALAKQPETGQPGATTNEVSAKQIEQNNSPIVPKHGSSPPADVNGDVAAITPAIAAKSVAAKPSPKETGSQQPAQRTEEKSKEIKSTQFAPKQPGFGATIAPPTPATKSAGGSAGGSTSSRPTSETNSPTIKPASGAVRQRPRPKSEFIPPPSRTSRPQSIASFEYCLDMGAEYDKSRFLIPSENQLSKHSSRNIGSATASVNNPSSLNLALDFAKPAALKSTREGTPQPREKEIKPEVAAKSVKPEETTKLGKPKKEVKLQEPTPRERAPGASSSRRRPVSEFYASSKKDRPLSTASLPFEYCLDLGAEYDKSRFMIPTEYQVAKPDPKYLHKTSHKRVASAPHMGDLRSMFVSSKDKPTEAKSSSREKSTPVQPKDSKQPQVSKSSKPKTEVSKPPKANEKVTRPRPVSEFIPPTRPLSMMSSQSSEYRLDSGAEYEKSRFMIPTENQLGKTSSPSSSRASLIIPPYVSKMDQPPLEKPAKVKVEKPVEVKSKVEKPVEVKPKIEKPVEMKPISKTKPEASKSTRPKEEIIPVGAKPRRPVSEFIPPTRPLSMVSVQSSDYCLDSGAEYEKSRFMIPTENQLGKTSSPSSSRASLVIPSYVSKMDQPPLEKSTKVKVENPAKEKSEVVKPISKSAPDTSKSAKPKEETIPVGAKPRRPVSEFIPPTRPLSMVSVQSSDYCLDSGAEYEKSSLAYHSSICFKMDQPPLEKPAKVNVEKPVEVKPVSKPKSEKAAKPVSKTKPVETKAIPKSPEKSVEVKHAQKSVSSPATTKLHRTVEVKPIPKFVHVSSKLQNPIEIKPIPQFVPPSVAKAQKPSDKRPLEKKPLANVAPGKVSSKSQRPLETRRDHLHKVYLSVQKKPVDKTPAPKGVPPYVSRMEQKPLSKGVPPYISLRQDKPVEKKPVSKGPPYGPWSSEGPVDRKLVAKVPHASSRSNPNEGPVQRPREGPREATKQVTPGQARPREAREARPEARPEARHGERQAEKPRDAPIPRASVKLRRRPVSELITSTGNDLRPPQPQQKRPSSFYLDSSSYRPIVPETVQPGTPKARPKPISNFRSPKKQSPIKKLFSPMMKKRVHFSPSSADTRTAPGGARILTAH